MFGLFRYFFAKKETLPWSNHNLKIQWEIHFFKRHFFRRNSPQKKKNSNYIVLDYKTAIRINFGTWEVPQPENA